MPGWPAERARRVWRIASARFPALDGEGARLWGGRWNSPGQPLVYASATVSLAALETLVWVDPADLPDDLVLYEIVLPERRPLARLEARDLPADWTDPGAEACREWGDRWLARGDALAVLVPSAVLPEATDEANVLINPRHPATADVHVRSRQPFRFDRRLLR